ncbi:glycosyltransferase family 4 protein [Adlercreutzia sp. ZJ141]|uniref:glycosyltransferase family 4 protein n=1 Tax=Adlercreutzia sp. ZJ141 TaxID=2709406 RepID=UPI0013EA4380|nr:glycosyltransferase family 4 protein [Adlercreutzia sp. ZJ141]
MYLMGLRDDESGRALREKIVGSNSIVLVEFVPAPQHLVFTKHAHIGLLPYQPAFAGRQSPLNALYCAPNKIWEYSRFGLPMIGSDVPGLTSVFTQVGLGVTCNINDPGSIVEAVRQIEADYGGYSKRSRAYFDSVNIVEIVRKILKGD